MSKNHSTNAIDKRLGQRVRMRRLEIGMSQERLAAMIGVTFQQVQKYERACNRIAASRLLDISTALDMPVARFFEGLSKRESAEEAWMGFLDDALASPEGVELLSLFSSIKSQKLRGRLVELVQSLLGE